MTREDLMNYAHRKRYQFLGYPIDALTMAETLEVIALAIRSRTPLYHVVVNVAKLVSMRHDRNLASDVVASDLTNIDGMGVVWGARLLGCQVPERVAGIDLMHAVLVQAETEGWRPYFLGARPEVLEKALENLRRRYPGLNIAGFNHGYFEVEEEYMIAAQIRAARADCLFVAMSSPKKEKFMNRWRDLMDVSFVMGVGGSLDVAAGLVRRAPLWVQSCGLEWLFRLLQEPRRMWKRYLLTNVAYALLLAGELLRKPSLPDSTSTPGGEP
jgi:N-acetylglucosaminyldiphosphoundecaprenol N-acetyl-beta-D-mannosaminyltransferase